MSIRWVDVRGYEGKYQVSSCGIVKSLGRIVRYSDDRFAARKERILRQGEDKDGYLKVTLQKNSEASRFSVHRLVATMFISEPKGLQVNHKDGNKRNNSYLNLEWVTCKQNIGHAHSTGLTRMNGESNASSKLKAPDVISIRKITSSRSMTHKEVAIKFNVSVSCIERISSGATWKKLK